MYSQNCLRSLQLHVMASQDDELWDLRRHTWSARASKSPKVPPQTATSQSEVSVSRLCRTRTTAGPRFGGAVFTAYVA